MWIEIENRTRKWKIYRYIYITSYRQARYFIPSHQNILAFRRIMTAELYTSNLPKLTVFMLFDSASCLIISNKLFRLKNSLHIKAQAKWPTLDDIFKLLCCMKINIFWFKLSWNWPQWCSQHEDGIGRHQAIILTTDGLVNWRIYASVCLKWVHRHPVFFNTSDTIFYRCK